MIKQLDNVNNLLKTAEKKSKEVDYNAALVFIDKAKIILTALHLEAVDHTLHISLWSMYYEQLFIVQQGLKKPKQLLATANNFLNDFSITDDILRSPSFIIARANFRLAYTIVALDSLDKLMIDDAIKHIEACFQLLPTTGEKKDPFIDCYEPRAIIYLKAFEKQSEKYKVTFYNALKQLEQKEKKFTHLNITNEALKAFMKSDAYLKVKQ